MTLADEIGAVRDRTLRELDEAHDYFTDVKFAWRIVRDSITAGRKFVFRNPATGTSTTQRDLARKARLYVANQLAEATFQQFLSVFEAFLFDFLRLWLAAYPGSLAARKVDFKVVLEAPDKNTIALAVIDKELNDVLYDRPTGWFAYLEEKIKLGCPTPDEIERISEAKATRDCMVHNRGVASKVYVAKAGRLARFQSGDRIDVSESCHREVWTLVRKMTADIASAAIAKFP